MLQLPCLFARFRNFRKLEKFDYFHLFKGFPSLIYSIFFHSKTLFTLSPNYQQFRIGSSKGFEKEYFPLNSSMKNLFFPFDLKLEFPSDSFFDHRRVQNYVNNESSVFSRKILTSSASLKNLLKIFQLPLQWSRHLVLSANFIWKPQSKYYLNLD